MSNFSDFIKNEKNDNYTSTINTEEKQVDKDKLEDMIENYSHLSQDELMNEFLKLTMEKKKKGALTDSELNNIKSTILPFLNEEQKSNLEKVLNLVRNV